MAEDAPADEPPECKVIGCHRDAVVTTAATPDAIRDSDATRIAEIRTSDGVFVMDFCAPCRRAFDYGGSMSDCKIIDEWDTDDDERAFIENSCVIHRSPDAGATAPEESL